MMRVLVTGASGFLGSHVVRALRDRGHDVVALCRNDVPAFLAEEGATVRRGDILDEDSVRDAAAGCDAVLHCAGKVSRDPNDAEILHRVHVVGTRNVLNACKAAKVTRAVIASTSGVVAVSEDGDAIANEETATPIGIVGKFPYYRSKLFAEQAALAMNELTFAVISVNPALLLGPGDTHGSSTEDVRLFLERKVPAVPDGGLSYVDARDAAEGMCLALERGQGGRRYLLGACNLTVREFFARLERVSGVKSPWLPLPGDVSRLTGGLLGRISRAIGAPSVDAPSLAMARLFWYLDSSRAERELGWMPRDPIATLADTVADLRARGVVWPASDTAS